MWNLRYVFGELLTSKTIFRSLSAPTRKKRPALKNLRQFPNNCCKTERTFRTKEHAQTEKLKLICYAKCWATTSKTPTATCTSLYTSARTHAFLCTQQSVLPLLANLSFSCNSKLFFFSLFPFFFYQRPKIAHLLMSPRVTPPTLPYPSLVTLLMSYFVNCFFFFSFHDSSPFNPSPFLFYRC